MTAARWIDIQGPSPEHVLSKTSAHLLVSKSPLHARQRKMRDVEADDETEGERETKEEGTIVHAMLLGAGKKITIIDADSYKTKAAREARDAARARGEVPVKASKERQYSAQARKLRTAIEAQGFALDGVSEPGIAWIEEATDGSGDTVECLGALDHWRPRQAMILDLKIARSAHPDACRKHLYAFGCDIQAAAYVSAVEKAHPEFAGRVRFIFLFCELYSGAVTPVELSGDFRRLGEMRWRRAVDTWARCLRENHWPGYTERPITIDAPGWALEAEMAAHHDDNERSFHQRPAGDDAGEEIDHGETDEDVF